MARSNLTDWSQTGPGLSQLPQQSRAQHLGTAVIQEWHDSKEALPQSNWVLNPIFFFLFFLNNYRPRQVSTSSDWHITHVICHSPPISSIAPRLVHTLFKETTHWSYSCMSQQRQVGSKVSKNYPISVLLWHGPGINISKACTNGYG